MSETEDDLDAIRDQKRKQLEEQSQNPTGPVHVESEEHLDQLLAKHDVVLVDFYADWCGPCKMLEPTIETLAAESDAVMAKVDVDSLQTLAQQYRVQGVPTLYLFAGGEPVEQMVGVQDKATLEQKITSVSA